MSGLKILNTIMYGLLVLFPLPSAAHNEVPGMLDSAGGSLPANYDCSQETGYITFEDLFGPGNVTGVSGNGSFTAGFGYAGELTVLRWPSPSYFDQIRYFTPALSNGCELRKRPHNGAQDNMGSFAGLYYETRDGHGQTTWFRDPSWINSQYYHSTESNVLVTRSENPMLGLSVEQIDFVHPDMDVFVRHYILSKATDSPITVMRIFYYENMELVTEKIPYLPINDWALESLFDFAVVYYSADDALIHFRPQLPVRSLVPGPCDPQEEIDRFVEQLDTLYPFDPGRTEIPVYLAIGADFRGLGGSVQSDAHQCGQQSLDESGWGKLQGAFYDSLDGCLQGASSAAGNVDAALMKKISNSFSQGSFTIYITAANHATEALQLLEQAKALGWEGLFYDTERNWSEWISRARMPKTTDPDILAQCKRTLISLRQGWDKHAGAFVASITTQPPYNVNWPRDGVYFAHAMDVAGFSEIAEKNCQFFARIQRDCQDPASPYYDIFCQTEGLYQNLFGWHFDGTYDMAYYADGIPGGPIFFEIDNSGLAVWGMWEHYHFLDEESGRKYLCGYSGDEGQPGVYQSIKRTAISLANCITPGDESGLQCHAFEDDSLELSQTLNGAISVYMALDAAIQAGEVCGEGPAQIQAWRERKEELREAINLYFWDPEEGHYIGTGPSAYMLWPAWFPIEPARFESNARYLFSQIKASLNKETTGNAYVGKLTLGLSKWKWDTGDTVYNLKWALDVLLKEVPMQGTLHYGEVFLTVDIEGDGTKEFSNRVAIPHLWEATLAYLSAMAYYGPAEPPPKPPTGEDNGGCGCSLLPHYRGTELNSVPVVQGPGLNLLLVILPCVFLLWRIIKEQN